MPQADWTAPLKSTSFGSTYWTPYFGRIWFQVVFRVGEYDRRHFTEFGLLRTLLVRLVGLGRLRCLGLLLLDGHA